MDESKKAKILLVDDDQDIQEFMTYNLQKANYKVYNALNGEQALEIAQQKKPNLIILDIMMPGMDGISVCEKIRANSKLDNVLICFLTARGEDYSQIAGFDAGADDYITKPVKPAVFLKKIEAMLRRSADNSTPVLPEKFVSGKLEIDFESRLVFLNKKEIIFAKKEFALLKLLVSNPGKVFTRDEIYTGVWGSDIVVGDRTIDVHIRKLREKIGEKHISTIKGVGYKFNKE